MKLPEIIIYLIFLILLIPLYTTCSSDKSEEKYYTPTEQELEQATELFEALLTTPANYKNLHEDWEEIHFIQTQKVSSTGKEYIQLSPTKKNKGGGTYLIHMHSSTPIVLQAPHSLDDTFTDSIATQLFHQHNPVAAGFSTLSRKFVDYTNSKATYFQSFTEAFINVYPMGKVLQLHGYRQEYRETETGKAVEVIVSNGSTVPANWINEYTNCLRSEVNREIVLYPYDISELGGTLNVQGELIRQMGSDGFLHIEMSFPTRKTMKDNKGVRDHLIECISEELF